jgi:hypothetical protein
MLTSLGALGKVGKLKKLISRSSRAVVCKQLEHVIASYLRKIWDKKDWLFEGQQWILAGIFM